MRADIEGDNPEREVGEIARAILDGRISVLAAARDLAAMRLEIDGAECDPDLLTFVGIYSEAVNLPLEPASRIHWNPVALAAKDQEISELEAWARELGMAAASRLASRFGTT